MSTAAVIACQERIEALRLAKLEQTRYKQSLGARDVDDKGSVPLPEEYRRDDAPGTSAGPCSADPRGLPFEPVSNHPSGGFLGAKLTGENFRAFMELHPTYIDAKSSLAGGWMVAFNDYWEWNWPPDEPEFDFSHLREDQQRYGIISGIGGIQHFCPDPRIGLELGWGGILAKISEHQKQDTSGDPERREFREALENTVLGIQDWIARHAVAAEEAAEMESDPALRENLLQTAAICRKQITDPPETFREACQWIAWLEMAACIFNTSGALGQIDELLRTYYERDVAAGTLDEEEAVWHLASLLLKETHYMQVGGPGPDGKDLTSRVSFLVLEAAHRLNVPANIAVRVHDGLDPALFDLAVKYLFEDRTGNPNWMGSKGLDEGFARNGYPMELARERVKCGCHWCALPGREYTMNDIVKINFACVFDAALREMMGENRDGASVAELWERFNTHLRRAVEVVAAGIDWHLDHYWKVHPELVLDLFCHGTIEKGLDATNGGVEFYNMCVDGSALATVADSFAALEQRVEREGRISWRRLMEVLDSDFEGAESERLMLANVPRFGSGGSRADEWAVQVSEAFASAVKAGITLGGRNMIPGLFSWASTIGMGRAAGATPNGRHARAPISHGPNPDPGFATKNAPTALARAVASVECGYGNTAPLQLDMDPGLGESEATRAKVGALIRTHCDMGGTMINLNVVNREQILDAHKDPSKYPDLVVRVTGFSAYFASLSEEFRQLVVDRIVEGG